MSTDQACVYSEGIILISPVHGKPYDHVEAFKDDADFVEYLAKKAAQSGGHWKSFSREHWAEICEDRSTEEAWSYINQPDYLQKGTDLFEKEGAETIVEIRRGNDQPGAVFDRNDHRLPQRKQFLWEVYTDYANHYGSRILTKVAFEAEYQQGKHLEANGEPNPVLGAAMGLGWNVQGWGTHLALPADLWTPWPEYNMTADIAAFGQCASLSDDLASYIQKVRAVASEYLAQDPIVKAEPADFSHWPGDYSCDGKPFAMLQFAVEGIFNPDMSFYEERERRTPEELRLLASFRSREEIEAIVRADREEAARVKQLVEDQVRSLEKLSAVLSAIPAPTEVKKVQAGACDDHGKCAIVISFHEDIHPQVWEDGAEGYDGNLRTVTAKP